jgi:tetratricopeptide (TPR) repeat protein
MDLLVQLVRRAGALVTKRELLEAVWPDAFVEEGIVAVHVSALRKALGDQRQPASYIQTVSRSGYRFVAGVRAEGRTIPAGAGGGALLPVLTPSGPEVYELVGRGRSALLAARRSDLPSAISAFERAIDLDPEYAPAHAGLALAYCAQAELRSVPSSEAYARARASALRALALDDRSADAQVALGAVMFQGEWNWVGAERSLTRALELSPNHTQARMLLGRLLEAQGRFDEGLQVKLAALERDPFSPSVHLGIALSYWHQRRFDESLRWANKTLELDPTHALAREFLAGAYWALGDFDRHMAENLTHAAQHGVPPEALDTLRRAYEAGGRAGVIRLALSQAARQPGAMPDFQLALMHGELGDLDAALPCLERAIDARDPCLVDLAVAPQWDALRGDARFAQCLAKMGLR